MVDFFGWSPMKSPPSISLYTWMATGDFENYVKQKFKAIDESKGRTIIFEVVFVWWLSDRAQTISQTVLISSFVCASSVIAANKIHMKRKLAG